MKKHIIIVILSCFSFYTQAQNFQLDWHATHGDSLSDRLFTFTQDTVGNLIMIGTFQGTVDFDPSQSTSVLYSPPNHSSDVGYVQKLDANQNLLWAKRFYSSSDDNVWPFYVDTDDSLNVYVYGYFQGDITFDGNVYYQKGATTNGTYFLTKLDASGNVQWGRVWSTTSASQSLLFGGMDVSKEGVIYLGMSFSDSLDMDPSSNSIQYYSSLGGKDGIVLKLNSNGELLKARKIGSLAAHDYVREITLDDDENIYIGGNFGGTFNFNNSGGSNIKTATTNSDMFMEKLDSSLAHQDVQVFTSTSTSSSINSMQVSSTGAVYCSGRFYGTVDFDPSSVSNSFSAQNSDEFLFRLTPNAHQLDWVTLLTGQGYERINTFDIAPNGNLLTVGNFENTANFGVGSNAQTMTSSGARDCFIALLDSTGATLNTQLYGMAGNDFFYQCIMESDHEFYVGGTYQNNLDLDPNGVGTVINSVGDYDIVYAKMSICQPQDTTLALTACGSYTVPSGNQTYTTSGIYNDTLSAISGCDSVLTINLTIAPNNFSPSISQTANGLDATASGSNLSYQWLDCSSNQIVQGAINQTFMPSANGDYAVIVSDSLCSDTSACFSINNVSINEEVLLDQPVIYPNPTTGLLNIVTNSTLQTIEVSDLMGRVLLAVKDPKSSVDLSRLPKGVYLVKVKTELGEVVRRVVKE